MAINRQQVIASENGRVLAWHFTSDSNDIDDPTNHYLDLELVGPLSNDEWRRGVAIGIALPSGGSARVWLSMDHNLDTRYVLSASNGSATFTASEVVGQYLPFQSLRMAVDGASASNPVKLEILLPPSDFSRFRDIT